MSGISKSVLLDGNDMFKEFKGALTEQYVLQQLKATTDFGIYYYTNDRNSCEIDFLLDDGEKVIPLEVKAEENLKAKSLKTYREKFKPALSIRASMASYRKEEDGLVNVPLYSISLIHT
jgi:predicted AAA+ superfamily ATPase